MQNRRFGAFRGRARVKRQGAWNGDLFLATALTTSVSSVFSLWSPATSQALNAAGKLFHRRTHLVMSPVLLTGGPATAGPFVWGWYVAVIPSQFDNSLVTSTQVIYSPLDQTATSHQKSVLDRGFRRVFASGGAISAQQNGDAGIHVERDLKAVRKMDDTEELVLVIMQAKGEDVPFDVQWRTYCTW